MPIADFGVILTRCVRIPAHNEYWIECIECIRKIYPDCPILVIDDNSDLQHVTCQHLFNVMYLRSEFPGAGEMLPFYYLHKMQLFQKALILHDSMFLQEPLDLDSVDDVCYLWDFQGSIDHSPGTFHELREALPIKNDLRFYQGWRGCFGVSCVITLDFVNRLASECGLFSPEVMNQTWSRVKRCSLERMFALCCSYVRKRPVPALFGDIEKSPRAFKYSYAHYWGEKVCDPSKFNLDKLKVIKVWSSR